MYTNLYTLEKIAKGDIKDRRNQADRDHMARLARNSKREEGSAPAALIGLAAFVLAAVAMASAI